MAPLGDDTERVEIIRVVERDATVQDAVSEYRHTVEQRGDGLNVSRRRGLDRPTGAECLDGGWKLRGRLWSNEHDVITDGERRLVALPQAQDFGSLEGDEGGLVRDLRDRRPVEELAADRTDRLFESG